MVSRWLYVDFRKHIPGWSTEQLHGVVKVEKGDITSTLKKKPIIVR